MEFAQNLVQMTGQAVDKVIGWINGLITMIPNLVVALLVILVAWIAGLMFSKLINRAMQRVTKYEEVRILIVRMTLFGTIAAGLVIALGVLDLDKTIASLLAGLGIIGLGLGFAFKDIASNFMAGLLLTFQDQFRVGDLIKTGDFHGRVRAINLRTTVGRNLQGQLVLIPNSQLLTREIINYSVADDRRVDLNCGVSYDDDLDKAEKLAVSALESLPERLPDLPVEMFYKEFGSSSINFTIRFWTKADQKEFLKARSAAIKVIKKTFDENGITMPSPIRTLDLGDMGEALVDFLKISEAGRRYESGVEAEEEQTKSRH